MRYNSKKRIAFHASCKLNFSETSTLSRDSLKYGYENVDSKEFATYMSLIHAQLQKMLIKKLVNLLEEVSVLIQTHSLLLGVMPIKPEELTLRM